MHYIVFTTIINDNFGIHKFYPVLPMGKTYPFTQFYPTGFTQWVKRTMPTLITIDIVDYRKKLFIIRYLCTMFYCKNRNVVDENIDEDDDDDDDDDVNHGDDYDDVKDDYDDDVDADVVVVMYGYVVERS